MEGNTRIHEMKLTRIESMAQGMFMCFFCGCERVLVSIRMSGLSIGSGRENLSLGLVLLSPRLPLHCSLDCEDDSQGDADYLRICFLGDVIIFFMREEVFWIT